MMRHHACHVIDHALDPRDLSKKMLTRATSLTYDADACHVIDRASNPSVLCYTP
jgi:hypothetical protein